MQSYKYSEDCRYAIFQDQNGPYLAHYQVKGAKHGVRRYQDYDGHLTPLGREHYGVGEPREKKSINSIKMNGKNVNVKLDGNAIAGAKNSVTNLRAKLNQMAEQRKANAAAKAIIKETKRQEKESRKEAKAAVKAAQKEAEDKERAEKEEAARIATEEAEARAEQARVDALKRYYRDHPLQIYSARDLLSQEDIKEVESQIRLDRELKDFRREEYMRYAKTLKDVAGVLDDTYKTAKSLKDIYNVGAETYNALIASKDPNDDKKPLRIIGNDQFKPKKPSDAATDKNSAQNQGKKKSVENQNAQSEEKPATEKKAQDTMDSLKKEMASKEKNSSSNAQSEQTKKNFENLAGSTKTDKETKSSASKPDYYKKVETSDGDTRYFYDKESYKSYDRNKDWAQTSAQRVAAAKSSDTVDDFMMDLGAIRAQKLDAGTWTSTMEGKYSRLIDETIKELNKKK